MISKESRSVMHICHIMIGATFLLLSTPQFDIAEGKALLPTAPGDGSPPLVDGIENDSQTAFELEQCGIPAPLFYQPSSQVLTGKSPFDSVCSSNAHLNLSIDKSVCKLFELLALNACSKPGDPQAVAAKYYNEFSQERSTLEQVCADFNNISLSAKSDSPTLDGYKLLHQAGTTLYFLAGEPSEKSICNLFCSMTASHFMMCKGLDFLLMTYIDAYQPKDGLEGGPSVSDESKTGSSRESGSQQNDPTSKEGTSSDNQEPTASVTDHHEPGSKQNDPASKEGTSPVNQELQEVVANDQETGSQQNDPTSKEGTSSDNQEPTASVTDHHEPGSQQNDPASQEGTSPVNQELQEVVANDQETGSQQNDPTSKEGTPSDNQEPPASVTDHHEPGFQQNDPASKEGISPVNQELQEVVANDQETGSQQNDPTSKEGTPSDNQEPPASVTDHHEPGFQQNDPASKEGISPVNQELQEVVANDQETGSQQNDPASKEGTSPINQELQEGVANDQETGYQQNDPASKEGTLPVNQELQEGVANDQETGYQQNDPLSNEDTLTVTEDENSSSSVSDFFEEETPNSEFGSKPDAGQVELDPYKQMDDTDMQTDEEEELEGGKGEGYQEHENTLLRVPEISSIDFDEEESSSHFMAYSLIAIIVIMATYIMYHNKQRIIAVIIEGRNASERRRRNNDGYQKLDQNLSDVMPSLQKSKEYKF